MSDSLTCPSCGVRQRLATSESVRIDCPKCGSEIEPRTTESAFAQGIPVPTRPTSDEELFTPAIQSDESPADVVQTLLAGFQGTVRLRGPRLRYRLALLVAAAAVLVLILLYLAIVAAIGLGLYWYATNMVLNVNIPVDGFMTIVWAIHIAIFSAGAMLLVTLIMPVLRRPEDAEWGTPLYQEDAPILFTFVNAIADALKVAPPTEIRLLAKATSAAGRAGFFGSRRTLWIGTPLIAGFDTQQLGGMIAHELGHFRQAGGMNLVSFITGFVRWCENVTTEQTRLASKHFNEDEAESSLAKFFVSLAGLLQALATLVVIWISRVGLMSATFAARQQEIDADRYSAALVGSDQLLGMNRRLIELMMGEQELYRRGEAYIFSLLRSSRGLAAYTAEVIAAADAVAARCPEVIERELQSPASWLDSHPSHQDRIAAVRARPQPGIFHLKMPGYRLYPRLNPHSAS